MKILFSVSGLFRLSLWFVVLAVVVGVVLGRHQVVDTRSPSAPPAASAMDTPGQASPSTDRAVRGGGK